MRKSSPTVAISGKAHAFASGFVAGLAAPGLLLAGVLEAPMAVRRTTLQSSVDTAGVYFSGRSVDQVRRAAIRRDRPA